MRQAIHRFFKGLWCALFHAGRMEDEGNFTTERCTKCGEIHRIPG